LDHPRGHPIGLPPTEEDVTIPVETAPGLIAQVDFGYVGFVVDPATGEPRKAWVFLMILGFSRHFFAGAPGRPRRFSQKPLERRVELPMFQGLEAGAGTLLKVLFGAASSEVSV